MSKMSFVSNLNSIVKDIKASDKKNRTEAAKYLVKKIRAKISTKSFDGVPSKPGETPHKLSGNLKKGIGYEHVKGEDKTKVGAGSPGWYAHILEFGTQQRVETTKNSKTRATGKIIARPFILPTFDEEKDAIEDILSKNWI